MSVPKKTWSVAAGSVVGTLIQIAPITWIVLRGTTPEWVRWWLAVWLVVWLLAVMVKAALT